MPVVLSLEERMEIVLIVNKNYKTFREATEIFKNRTPEKNIHNSIISILEKFIAD